MEAAERIARNQSWFRDANEDIARARRDLGFDGDGIRSSASAPTPTAP